MKKIIIASLRICIISVCLLYITFGVKEMGVFLGAILFMIELVIWFWFVDKYIKD